MPIAPPRRITTFSCGVASDSWSGRIEANAAVIAGMNDRPMLTPRTTSTNEINTIDVWSPTNASGIVLTASTQTPASATGPPPKRSARRPATGIASSAPMPCGPVSRPVSITLRPRTSW